VPAPTGAPACSLVGCTPDGLGLADSAGNLTIAGGGIPPGTTVMEAGSGGFGGYAFTASGNWMAPGQSVTVQGAGGQVPAFGPWAVIVAKPVTLTAPAYVDGGATTIDTSSDYTVSWTGGQSGTTVNISMVVAFETTLSCTWDAALGHGTIPKALLSGVALQTGGMGSISYGVQTTNTFTAGPYAVAVTAALGSSWPVAFK
jgi:hypothetical protein